MDKWEQVARETCAAICRCDGDEATAELLIASALRQCEADTIRRCADVCDEQSEAFLSPEYAVNQPLSSFGERFACGQVKNAILAMEPVR